MVPITVGHRRTGLCPTFARPTLQRDGYLLRVPLVGGFLTIDQVDSLAGVALHAGNGIVELTNRGNLQLRGIAQEGLAGALEACQAVGLGDYSTSLVTISPFAGPAERRLRESLVRALADIDAERLSRKFAVHVDDAAGHTADRPADLVVRLTDVETCQVAVRALGSTRASTDDVAPLARRLAETCIQHGPHARPADIAHSAGPAALAAALGAARTWLPSPSPARSRPLDVGIARWPRSAVQQQRCGCALAPEYALVEAGQGSGPGITGDAWLAAAAARFGRLGGATMAGLGRLLRRQQLESLTVTPWRSFAFACSSANQAAAVLADAAALGLLTDSRDPALGVITCIGSAGCWQTELDTLAEAERFVTRRPADLEPGALVHVSGCDKLCATRAPVALTLLGRADQSGFDTLASPPG